MAEIAEPEIEASRGRLTYDFNLISIRIVTAVTLFAVLGEANIWLDATTNTVLALGYRFGLVLLPVTIHLFGGRSLLVSLAAMAAGAGLLSLNGSLIQSLSAACLFSYGAANSGYLIKNVAAQSKRGSANNRIAMNVGAFTAGLVIMLPFLRQDVFFWCAAALIAFCALVAMPRRFDTTLIHVKIFQGQSAGAIVAWISVGTAMGMMLFGVFSVLPQTILKSGQSLPVWYGPQQCGSGAWPDTDVIIHLDDRPLTVVGDRFLYLLRLSSSGFSGCIPRAYIHRRCGLGVPDFAGRMYLWSYRLLFCPAENHVHQGDLHRHRCGVDCRAHALGIVFVQRHTRRCDRHSLDPDMVAPDAARVARVRLEGCICI